MGALRKMRLVHYTEDKPLQPLRLTGLFKEGDTCQVIAGKHKGRRVTVRHTINGIVFVMQGAHNFHVKESELKWLTSSRG